MGMPNFFKPRNADESPTYLHDVISEVLANNGVRPNKKLVEDLFKMPQAADRLTLTLYGNTSNRP